MTPTAVDRNSPITVDGATVASGATSSSVKLAVGSTTVSIVVASQNGSATPRSYTITVTRDVGTLKKGKTMTARAAMISADGTIPRGAKVRVKSLTSRVCRSSGQSIKGLKVGNCRVRITVTPKKTKANPRPRAVTTAVTIRVV